MPAKIFSACTVGINCELVEVEADISRGLSSFSIVGLGDASVQESKERVRSAIKNSGLTFPITKKTVNLAPAEIKKQGSMFDLPIAIGILCASGQITEKIFDRSMVVGELSLSGELKPIKGMIAIARFAHEKGFKRIFLPKKNMHEALLVDGIVPYGADNLKDLVGFCKGQKELSFTQKENIEENNTLPKERTEEYTFDSIVGLEKAKRALTIAAAGGHNILLKGLPGTGKTILARAFQSLLPKLSKEESFEVTKIYSILYGTDHGSPLITTPPFRQIHHTASKISIIGGGANLRPGEITLAHRGVLFMDEFSEFSRDVVESLRQPLEDGFIIISRAKNSVKFPCQFILLAAMNNCPCGLKSSDEKNRCKCTYSEIKKYENKISGPIIDRFDMFIETPQISLRGFMEGKTQLPNTSFQELKSKIALVRARQKERYSSDYMLNTNLQATDIKKHCSFSKGALETLDKAAENLKLSNRGYLKTIKLAQTMADIENRNSITIEDILEAIQYRKKEN
ncbi:MAG TPA: YifB family Mg chelatase-like AAA ATPase [Candidatus Gracilibacteria bacterium]|nr:YifB family Mg chelatase-like AAA ATPase [Candidatus Gracilibacteria bacterium]